MKIPLVFQGQLKYRIRMKPVLSIALLGVFIILCPFEYAAGSPEDKKVSDEDAVYKELRSEHFIIKYDADVKKSYIYKIKNDAELFYRSITREFNLIRDKLWIWDDRAKIYIAKDKESYLKRFECQKWSGACVNYYTKVIYTFPMQKNFSLMLKHELTHIILREYIGYAKFPLWLDEGMAMFIQNKGTHQEKLTLAQIKKIIKKEKYIKFSEIQNIYSLSDDEPRVEIFYHQSFSMVYFLMKSFGRFHFKEFLSCLKRGYDFSRALRKSFITIEDIESFERKWKRFYLK